MVHRTLMIFLSYHFSVNREILHNTVVNRNNNVFVPLMSI